MNTTSKFLTRGLSIVLIASAFFSGKIFAAEPAYTVRNEVIKYQDLDLNTPAGVASLYQRIHGAAKQVCSLAGDDNRDLAAHAEAQKCIAQSVASAVDSIHSGALSAYYQAKLGRSAPSVARNN